jgi:hypothetical protein
LLRLLFHQPGVTIGKTAIESSITINGNKLQTGKFASSVTNTASNPIAVPCRQAERPLMLGSALGKINPDFQTDDARA